MLDTSALLAYLRGESGSARVRELLQLALKGRCRVHMSVVNLGEVIYITEKEKGMARAQELLARIDELPITLRDADRPVTAAAAHLKACWPMAYTGCFAAALAAADGARLVTGDPESAALEKAGIITADWIRQ